MKTLIQNHEEKPLKEGSLKVLREALKTYLNRDTALTITTNEKKLKIEILSKKTSHTVLNTASRILSSFSLYPDVSLESNLNNINYPNSIEQGLARDWQNVGSDLWKGYIQQVADNNE